MEFLNPEKKRMVRVGRFPIVWTAAVTLIVVTGLSGTALGANRSVETVTYSPQEFNFEVHPQGGFSGNNNITFILSREEDPGGITQRCKKVQWLVVAHDPDPVYGRQHPGDYIFGKRELDPPLCSFSNVEISGNPFQDVDVNSVCFETPMRSLPGVPGKQVPSGSPIFQPGKSGVLEKEMTIAFQQDGTKPQFNQGIPNKKVLLKANIQCAANTPSSGIGSTRGGGIITPINNPKVPVSGGWTPGTGTGSGTGTTGGAAQCDLTGTWDGYNNGTRTTGWQFDQIFTAGGSITYRATHLTAQRSPAGGEGTITRSSSGNYLFHTLPTKIPTANAAYQASTMRTYDAAASCGKLTERQLYDTTSGMVNRGGTYWLQRVSTSSNPPSRVETPVSPVGKPTSPTTVFKPRSAPDSPGSTFKPGPNTPKPTEPNWNR